MADLYIKRRELVEQVTERLRYLRKEYGDYDHYTDGFDECVDRILDAPTVEAVHGEWILLDECANEGVYCSVCHISHYY